MIGLVLVGHGRLAQDFVETLEHVVGEQGQIVAISLNPNDDIEAKREEILVAVKKANNGKGVVILTDMFGGTPSNLAHSVLYNAGVEIVSGMNLPLLIKLASVRKTMELQEAVQVAQEAGRKYIHVASHALNEAHAETS